jgi:hypothetical protein
MEPLRLTLELWSLTLEEPWLTLGLWRIWELCFYEAPDLDPHQSFPSFPSFAAFGILQRRAVFH